MRGWLSLALDGLLEARLDEGGSCVVVARSDALGVRRRLGGGCRYGSLEAVDAEGVAYDGSEEACRLLCSCGVRRLGGGLFGARLDEGGSRVVVVVVARIDGVLEAQRWLGRQLGGGCRLLLQRLLRRLEALDAAPLALARGSR
jgi:hypothetical protein